MTATATAAKVLALAAALTLAPVAAPGQQVGHLLWQRYHGPGERWFKADGVVRSAVDCIDLKRHKDANYGSVVQSACVRVGEDPEEVVRGGRLSRPDSPPVACPGTSVWNGVACTTRTR